MDYGVTLKIASYNQPIHVMQGEMLLYPEERGSEFLSRTPRFEIDMDQFECSVATFDSRQNCSINGRWMPFRKLQARDSAH